MSHTFSATIEVPHPPSEVWKTLCDTDHWEQWATFRVVKRGPLAVGEPVTIGFRAMGLPLRGAARFIEVRPEQALWWRGGLAPLLRVEHGFSLMPHGGGTRLVHEERFSGPLTGLILWALGPGHASNYERTNRGLVAFMGRA